MYAVGVASSNPAQALRDAGADEVIDDLRGYDVPALLERLRRRGT
jgi:hypothetical protein